MESREQPAEIFLGEASFRHRGQNRQRSVMGKAGRLISGRLRPGSDLIGGILEMAREHGVRAAWVQAFGSLIGARLAPGIKTLATRPSDAERLPILALEGHMEIWAGQGKLAMPSNGEATLHFHGVLVKDDGSLVGGHFMPGGCPVFVTIEVWMEEILEVEHLIVDDPEVGAALLEARPAQ